MIGRAREANLIRRNKYRQVITSRTSHGTTTWSVRLTATNATGSNTKTRTNYITVTH